LYFKYSILIFFHACQSVLLLKPSQKKTHSFLRTQGSKAISYWVEMWKWCWGFWEQVFFSCYLLRRECWILV